MIPLISVIIPHKNDSYRLKRCIDALSQQTYPRELFEIIVIDNGSNEYHAKNLSNLPKPGNLIYLTEHKRGSYAARNKGIKTAKGDYLAFTDSDCIPDENWLASGINTISEYENLGFVSGKVEMVFRNGNIPNIFELYDSVFYLRQDVYINLNFGATANLFTSKKIISKVGPFNDNFISCGDAEWCKRVFSNGYAVKYSESCIVKHPARETFSAFIKKQLRIIRGKFDLDNLYSYSRTEILYKNLFNIIPPILSTFKLIRNEKLQIVDKFSTKLKIAGLRIFVRYLKVCMYFIIIIQKKIDSERLI